jgi:N6-adenosine-specific RNA methylase IME4
MHWPFEGLRPLTYRTILADPAWLFKNFSPKGEVKNPIAYYDCMDLEAIKALPVNQLAAPDCLLVMWATAPMLPQALDVMNAWGKQSKTGAKLAFGTGYWLRSAAEPYLLGTLGDPRILSRSIRNLILAPVREHSRKPDQMHADLEKLTDGPRCELFARRCRDGWDCWGNELEAVGNLVGAR